jgi:hypothetical protein
MGRPVGVTILAILMILWGFVPLIFGFIDLGASAYAWLTFWAPAGLGIIGAIIEIIWGILYLAGGFGLLSLKNWARILAIIINILGLIGGIILTVTIVGAIIGIPMIILSIIIIWYLAREETAAYFT